MGWWGFRVSKKDNRRFNPKWSTSPNLIKNQSKSLNPIGNNQDPNPKVDQPSHFSRTKHYISIVKAPPTFIKLHKSHQTSFKKK